MTMTPFIAVWAAMALVVLILAAWRQFIDLHEDDTVHLADGEQGMIKEQETLARKVGKLTLWSRVMTAATVAYGIGLAGFYLYQQWIESTKLPGS